jgi:hypothetical protein
MKNGSTCYYYRRGHLAIYNDYLTLGAVVRGSSSWLFSFKSPSFFSWITSHPNSRVNHLYGILMHYLCITYGIDE